MLDVFREFLQKSYRLQAITNREIDAIIRNSLYIVEKSYGKYALMDKTGKFITPAIYDKITSSGEKNTLKVVIKSDSFYIDYDGNRVEGVR